MSKKNNYWLPIWYLDHVYTYLGLRLGLILLNGARGCDCIERRINHFWKKSKSNLKGYNQAGCTVLSQVYIVGDIKVCADGAANRLMLIESNENFIPDIICGDFDSIDETVARKKFDEQVDILQLWH